MSVGRCFNVDSVDAVAKVGWARAYGTLNEFVSWRISNEAAPAIRVLHREENTV